MVLGAQPDMDVVGVAGGVAEVCEMEASLRPDVVLMDYALPDGDGVAATATIKAARPDVRVVMLTSFLDVDVLVAAIEAGCSGFVTKHKAAEELTTAVRLAVEGGALVSPDMLARLLPRLRQSYHGVGADLTPREREVLDLLATGLSNRQIADRLVLSARTVEKHVERLLQKTATPSRTALAVLATKTYAGPRT